MTVSLEQIIAGHVDRLETIDPEVLNVLDHVAAEPPYPAVMILPPVIDYRLTMRAGVITIKVELFIAQSWSAGFDEAQAALWPYLDWDGDRSIFQALDADPTLGGLPGVDAHILEPSRPLGLEEIAATQAFGAVLTSTTVLTRSLTP